MSNVDVIVSASPNGNINGIQPTSNQSTEPLTTERKKTAQTSSILKRKAPLMHLILLRRSPRQKMHRPSRVPLHLQRARLKSPLLPNQNIKIIISSMQPRMSLRAQRRPKNNKILRNARVDDVHRTHRSTRIVEHPFGRVWIEPDLGVWVREGEVGEDVLDHAGGGVG